MATTVHVQNISPQTDEPTVRDFFSFCGKIQNLSLTPTGNAQSATVTFEKATAAKTALLLDSTQLGPNLVQVSAAQSLEEMTSPKAGDAPATGDHDVDQEDKPRSRIVAEYLAHGYTISDQAIERALNLDKQHGVSSRFTAALTNFDSKYKATEKAQGLDQKYGVSEKANAGWRGLNSYFEKAMGTPSGQKVRAFYMDGQKQVLDVHNEARRLADLKAGRTGGQAQAGASADPAINPPQSVPGTDGQKTTCKCGGDTSVCPCAPGKCSCASCPKSHSGTSLEKEQAHMEVVPGTERTKCNCAGNVDGCPCEPGKCACGSCAKNPDMAQK